MEVREELQAATTLPAVATEYDVGGTHGLEFTQLCEINGDQLASFTNSHALKQIRTCDP
jgi:hypothetical protein